MTRKYTITVEKGKDGWYVSEVVELPGCHTQAKNIDQLIERTKEAIMAYLGTDRQPDILIDQNSITKKRLSDVKNKKIIGKSEKELDSYLIKRGVKDNALLQLRLSLEDLCHGRVKKFKLKCSYQTD